MFTTFQDIVNYYYQCKNKGIKPILRIVRQTIFGSVEYLVLIEKCKNCSTLTSRILASNNNRKGSFELSPSFMRPASDDFLWKAPEVGASGVEDIPLFISYNITNLGRKLLKSGE